MRFVISMLAALMLTACASTRMGVPHNLIDAAREACVEPVFSGTTNMDLVLHTLDVKRALRACRGGTEALATFLEEAR